MSTVQEARHCRYYDDTDVSKVVASIVESIVRDFVLSTDELSCRGHSVPDKRPFFRNCLATGFCLDHSFRIVWLVWSFIDWKASVRTVLSAFGFPLSGHQTRYIAVSPSLQQGYCFVELHC